MHSKLPIKRFFRLPKVLDIVSISRSSWYAGIKAGKYPPGVKIGPNTRAWTDEEIDALIQKLAGQQSGPEVPATTVALLQGEISTSNEKNGDENRTVAPKRGNQRQNVSKGEEK